MQSYIAGIIGMWQGLLIWAAIFAVAFHLLAKLTPCNRSMRCTAKEIITDLTYCLIAPVLNRIVYVAFISAGVYVLFRGESQETITYYLQNGHGYAATLPLWAQIAITFILADIILYWIHRMFHGRELWKLHAIHHSSEHVDWHSTYRFHPINSWLAFTFTDALMLMLGFSPAAVASMAGFNMIYSAMVHANLNWTFGPFKYVFASPVFHRWHHTLPDEGGNKNFAPTFPVLDVMFGTFYMPEGKLPETYGVTGAKPPGDFLGQLVWPFRK